MLTLGIIVASPFIVWLWLGVSFTIIDYGIKMSGLERTHIMTLIEKVTAEVTRARLIRYTDLTGYLDSMPGLLSYYDERTNVLFIDRAEADKLSRMIRDRLEMTEELFTKVDTSKVMALFVPYHTAH